MAVVELEYLSSQQVGKQLGISAARVRAYRREGRLSAVHTPLGNLHPLDAVLALAQERDRVRAVRQEGRLKVASVTTPPRSSLSGSELRGPGQESDSAPARGVTFDDVKRVLRASQEGSR